MSMVQGWTRVGTGPWSPVENMKGDARALVAVVKAANEAATGGEQYALFSIGYNPNR